MRNLKKKYPLVFNLVLPVVSYYVIPALVIVWLSPGPLPQ